MRLKKKLLKKLFVCQRKQKQLKKCHSNLTIYHQENTNTKYQLLIYKYKNTNKNTNIEMPNTKGFF